MSFKYIYIYIYIRRYIKCKELASISKNQVKNNQMKIVPEQFVQDWYRWLGMKLKESFFLAGEGKH